VLWAPPRGRSARLAIWVGRAVPPCRYPRLRVSVRGAAGGNGPLGFVTRIYAAVVLLVFLSKITTSVHSRTVFVTLTRLGRAAPRTLNSRSDGLAEAGCSMSHVSAAEWTGGDPPRSAPPNDPSCPTTVHVVACDG
jgi:hypothetical protein